MNARILIVEDDPGMGEMLASDLQRRGFAVELCTAAEPALATMTEVACDLVLTDLNLPGMNGLALC